MMQMTHWLMALVFLTPTAQAAPECFDAKVYEASEAFLETIPTERDRAAIDSVEVASAYADLETALVLFHLTRGESCRTAEPAQDDVDTAIDKLAAASAGPDNFECFCKDAEPIAGHFCDSCDYHPTWGCQCWFYPNG